MPVRRPTRAASHPGRLLAVVVGLALVASAGAPGLITVERGDTLSDLAKAHGTSVAAIKAANGRAADTIYAGEVLRIPGSVTPATTSTTTEATHVVRSGETVTGIARQYGTSVRALVARNELPGNGFVVEGRRLAVPKTTRTVRGSTGATTVTVRGSSPAASAARHRAELSRRDLPSKAEARALVADAARRHGVPVSLAVAVAYHESGFQQRVVSGVDAIGIMQVLPRTGKNLEDDAGRPLDLLDARDNTTAGVLLLRELLRSEGDRDAALAGYYQGVGSIAAKGILPQTRDYLRSIQVLEQRFRNG